MEYYASQANATSFCGNQNPKINYDLNETALIQTGKNYTKGSRVHCYYKFDLESYYGSKYNPRLEIELMSGKNKLKFNLMAAFVDKQGFYTYAYIDMFIDEDIRNNSEIINLSTNDSVEIYIDFLENQYSQIDESLRIKFKQDKKPNLQNGSKTDDTDSPVKEALYTIGGCIILILIVAFAFQNGARCECDCYEYYIVEKRKRKFCIIF